jgi:hypothetical protein
MIVILMINFMMMKPLVRMGKVHHYMLHVVEAFKRRIACITNDSAIIETLLLHQSERLGRSQLNGFDYRKETPLHYICRQYIYQPDDDKDEIIRLLSSLISEKVINAMDQDGDTPLHLLFLSEEKLYTDSYGEGTLSILKIILQHPSIRIHQKKSLW